MKSCLINLGVIGFLFRNNRKCRKLRKIFFENDPNDLNFPKTLGRPRNHLGHFKKKSKNPRSEPVIDNGQFEVARATFWQN